MPKAIIFDLNGIFIQSPKLSDRFQNSFNVPKNEFLPALTEIMTKVRRLGNNRPSFTYWQPHLKKWGVKFSKKEFFDFWFSAEKTNMEMVELARKLKQQGIKLFILSDS